MSFDEDGVRGMLLAANFAESDIGETALLLSQFPEQSAEIARVFGEVFQNCENARRMFVLHLVNEVIQVSLDTTSSFLVSFGHVLPSMASAVGRADDEALRGDARELFRFWQSRSLFSQKVVADLFARCSPAAEEGAVVVAPERGVFSRRMEVKAVLSSPLAIDVAALLALSEDHNRTLLSKLAETELAIERHEENRTESAVKLRQLRDELEELQRAYFDFVAVSCWKMQEIAEHI